MSAVAITAPGLYPDMPNDIYHADPCPEPSLSAGLINTMQAECPRKAWWDHPRLNPDHEHADSPAFDIGSAAHLIFLEPARFDASVSIIKADDYRTAAAKASRDAARDAGLVPLLARQEQQIRAMHKALFAERQCRDAFTGGRAEVSMFWRHAEHGVWCRARPDYIPDNGRWIVDYKTAASANPNDFGRASYNLGYYQRAAWYLDGYQAITGKLPDHYWFVVQEKEPPYIAEAIELDWHAIDAGREECRRAARRFAECLKAGVGQEHWPSYGSGRAIQVGLPMYAHQQIQDRLDGGKPPAPPAASAKRAALSMYEGV